MDQEGHCRHCGGVGFLPTPVDNESARCEICNGTGIPQNYVHLLQVLNDNIGDGWYAKATASHYESTAGVLAGWFEVELHTPDGTARFSKRVNGTSCESLIGWVHEIIEKYEHQKEVLNERSDN